MANEFSAYGETIRPVVINGSVFIFYTDYEGVLNSYDIQSLNNTKYTGVELGTVKLDVSILGNTIILVGYSEGNTKYPIMVVGSYENGTFTISPDNITEISSIQIDCSSIPIDSNNTLVVLSGVFFTEPDKFFLAAISQSAAAPA
jgi:hypothetical protein